MKKLSPAQEKALEVIKTGKVEWISGMGGIFSESFRAEKGKQLNRRTVRCLIDRGLCRIDRDGSSTHAPVIYTGDEAVPETAPEAVPEAVPEKSKENMMHKVYQYGYRTIINRKIITRILGTCNQDEYEDKCKEITSCNYIESEAYNPKGMRVPAKDSYFIQELKDSNNE